MDLRRVIVIGAVVSLAGFVGWIALLSVLLWHHIVMASGGSCPCP